MVLALQPWLCDLQRPVTLLVVNPKLATLPTHGAAIVAQRSDKAGTVVTLVAMHLCRVILVSANKFSLFNTQNVIEVKRGTVQANGVLSLRWFAVQSNAMQCNAVQCSAVQCSAMQCS